MNPVRRALSWLVPTRQYAIAFGLLGCLAIGLCFVPLFNLVGYESAAFFGVAGGLLATGLTLHSYRIGALEPVVEAVRSENPLVDFTELLGRHLAMLALPLAVLMGNAVWVPNCDMWTGLGFWLLIPAFSVLMGQCVAWGAVALAPQRRKTRMALAYGALALTAIWLGLHLALQPPIIGHHLLLGYFAGSIYDEALAIPSSLIWYRFINLAGAAALLMVIEAVRRRGERPAARRWLMGAAVLMVAFLAAWGGRQHLGIDINRGHIAESLAGVVETEHFVIHYPLREPYLEQLPWLIEDHEFRYSQLKDFFKTDPVAESGKKIRSFVYPGRDEKGRLMGARNTLIAKIWLHEMHILWRGYGDHTLTHELAHLFTEPFGAGPLRLSMQMGIGVNMGLVEGVATAADWPVADLTPHEASAAMRRLEIAPDIRRLVGASGFWSQASGRAYTLMGSFVRYLIDSYGIEAFKKAYPSGDFQSAYDRSAHALVTEWEAFLDATELDERQLEVARYFYDRPGIFGKVCPRTVAELQRQASVHARGGAVDDARVLFERILDLDAGRASHHLEYARVLQRARHFDAAGEVLRKARALFTTPVEMAELRHLSGDLSWQQGNSGAAREAYHGCLKMGVPVDMERALRVKAQATALEDAELRALAHAYLLGERGSEVDLFYPMEWLRRDPKAAVPAYLIGRRLWGAMRCGDALPLLESIQGQMDAPVLDAEAGRMLGQCLYFEDRLDEAEAVLKDLSETDISAYAVDAAEWLARVAWKRRNSEEMR